MYVEVLFCTNALLNKTFSTHVEMLFETIAMI